MDINTYHPIPGINLGTILIVLAVVVTLALGISAWAWPRARRVLAFLGLLIGMAAFVFSFRRLGAEPGYDWMFFILYSCIGQLSCIWINIFAILMSKPRS